MQVATQVFPFFHIPEWVARLIVVVAVIGFPFALVLSWIYKFTPKGFMRESGRCRRSRCPRPARRSFQPR